MVVEAVRVGLHGGSYAIVHFSTFDAKFKHCGRTVMMSFHHYCGPMFEYTDEEELFPDDSAEYDDLWRQFNGWWEAKGKLQYGFK
jgi:hypothetical protein